LSAGNIDLKTVEGFGEEWESYDQTALTREEHEALFDAYFSIFPFEGLAQGEGFDLGSGSGRWAALVAPRVGKLHCIDPAAKALEVSRRRLANLGNVQFHHAGVDNIPLADGSQDFGYSLGVLHHIPDTEAALAACVRKLRPGAPFLVYLYYDFDNRGPWFKLVWRASELGRAVVSRLPFPLRKAVTTGLALSVYYPLARTARFLERRKLPVGAFPLSAYRHLSFYTMRTDALDRFGTRLEQRFSRRQIEEMMKRSGLTDIRFSDRVPYWVACGRKA
jgi:ubiquinone/menaquinone biosynthesis C-methylase UbiE